LRKAFVIAVACGRKSFKAVCCAWEIAFV
jgi:hypothetical protein